MIDIVETLRLLAELRPMFHLEADFQHAIAWQIHEQHPDLRVRLEYRPSAVDRKMYVDIWLERDGAFCAIELKYKTRRFSATVEGETFDLLDQSAQDIARYDFCKDISRVEMLAKEYPGLIGFAVFLTNDHGYWQDRNHGGTVDAAFRMHQGAELAGELSWDKRASVGTTKGRTAPISLMGSYPLGWMNYSDYCGSERNSMFRFLAIPIRSTVGKGET